MSPEDFPFLIEEEAANEIAGKQKDLRNAILVEAINLAYKEGHTYIDKTCIKKASQRVRILGRSKKVVLGLRIVTIILGLLIPIQIGGLLTSHALALPIGVQMSLWILPIFSIIILISILYISFRY